MVDCPNISTGSVLGGSPAVIGADALRAARLARLGGPSSASALPMAAQPEVDAQYTVSSDAALPPDASTPGVVPNRSAQNVVESSPLMRICGAKPAVVAPALDLIEQDANPNSTSVFRSSFACLPEGALLRIAALTDMQSGLAFATACSASGETTTPAFTALRHAIERARQEHLQTTQAIEQDRAHSHHTVTAEQQAHAAALAALAPLRGERHMERHPQLAQIFGMLEEASTPTPGATAEMEAALAARMAAAVGALHANEAAARARVAEGELRAAAIAGCTASVGTTASA